MEQLSFIREWGGRFAVRTPELARLRVKLHRDAARRARS